MLVGTGPSVVRVLLQTEAKGRLWRKGLGGDVIGVAACKGGDMDGEAMTDAPVCGNGGGGKIRI